MIGFFRTSDDIVILHEESSTSQLKTRSAYARIVGIVIAVVVAPLFPECTWIEHPVIGCGCVGCAVSSLVRCEFQGVSKMQIYV